MGPITREAAVTARGPELSSMAPEEELLEMEPDPVRGEWRRGGSTNMIASARGGIECPPSIGMNVHRDDPSYIVGTTCPLPPASSKQPKSRALYKRVWVIGNRECRRPVERHELTATLGKMDAERQKIDLRDNGPVRLQRRSSLSRPPAATVAETAA